MAQKTVASQFIERVAVAGFGDLSGRNADAGLYTCHCDTDLGMSLTVLDGEGVKQIPVVARFEDRNPSEGMLPSIEDLAGKLADSIMELHNSGGVYGAV